MTEYFTIPITARSVEERQKRIADNELRGFELVKMFENLTEVNGWRNKGFQDEGGVRLQYDGTDSHTSYCAIMRRENTKPHKSKSKAWWG